MYSSFRRFCMLGGLLLLPLSADAIREDCTDGLSSELPVRVQVEIPAFLYFQVGSENQVAKVSFDASEGMTQGHYRGDTALQSGDNLAPHTITGSDAADGVNVRLRSNCGQVKLSYSVSDGQGLSNGNGHYIDYETLTTQSTDSGLPAPVLNNAASDDTQPGTTSYGLVTDRSAVWQYRYNNAEMPASGVYQGRVTYQASCL